ncbi:hypothetical protein LOTGIDRAFT_152928 [Lottia gigantea]|uniref:Protein quiver n=1 Tax=Lottia gigantea TaxID=225164 RepID=V4C7X1_LOTGI|nr:hypothetical protein LOTGIDRAFT_152928 [Lottia gigantea]ESO97824.1 hypothetical protein LOTGIDRAFT_152928 [Lottia gigantea]
MDKEAIKCLQCNIVVKGSNNNCDDPKYVDDCTACLKTYTKIVNHESWRNTKESVFESRLCIRKTATTKLRENGCYYNTNNGGYTEQCYCYNDNCNSANGIQWKPMLLVTAFVAVFQLILA